MSAARNCIARNCNAKKKHNIHLARCYTWGIHKEQHTLFRAYTRDIHTQRVTHASNLVLLQMACCLNNTGTVYAVAFEARMMPTVCGDRGGGVAIRKMMGKRRSCSTCTHAKIYIRKCLPAIPRTNQTIQGQSFCENENENHTHVQLGLLCIGPVCGWQQEMLDSRENLNASTTRIYDRHPQHTPQQQPGTQTHNNTYRTPESPTMPIAMPAAKPASPHAKPEPKWA